jgi:hypothetical protein
MSDDSPVLRLPGLPRSAAHELADEVGPEAVILPDEAPPIGGYGDLGTRTVAVAVSTRALRAVARYLAGRQHSRAETVSVLVQIDNPGGTRHEQRLIYEVAPGQGSVQAAETALRALPGITEALDRSLW